MDSDESAYLLKMVRQIKNIEKSQANGVQDNSATYIGVGDDYDMTFNVKDVTEFAVDGVQLSSQDRHQNGKHLGVSSGSLNSPPRLRIYSGFPHRCRYLWQFGSSRTSIATLDLDRRH